MKLSRESSRTTTNTVCPFPVGGVYISTNPANPNTVWGGTSWDTHNSPATSSATYVWKRTA